MRGYIPRDGRCPRVPWPSGAGGEVSGAGPGTLGTPGPWGLRTARPVLIVYILKSYCLAQAPLAGPLLSEAPVPNSELELSEHGDDLTGLTTSEKT